MYRSVYVLVLKYALCSITTPDLSRIPEAMQMSEVITSSSVCDRHFDTYTTLIADNIALNIIGMRATWINMIFVLPVFILRPIGWDSIDVSEQACERTCIKVF